MLSFTFIIISVPLFMQVQAQWPGNCSRGWESENIFHQACVCMSVHSLIILPWKLRLFQSYWHLDNFEGAMWQGTQISVGVDIRSSNLIIGLQFSSIQLLSRVWFFATPWITAHQASLSITNSRSSPRLTSESVTPSSHLILCRSLLLLPPTPPSIRVFSNESTLRMRWPKYWSFSFSINPSNEHPGLISFRMDWLEI